MKTVKNYLILNLIASMFIGCDLFFPYSLDEVPASSPACITGDVIESKVYKIVISGKLNIDANQYDDFTYGIWIGEDIRGGKRYVANNVSVDNTFNVEITDLEQGEHTYRAFVCYEDEYYRFGEEKTFTIYNPFSISSSNKVIFSSGMFYLYSYWNDHYSIANTQYEIPDNCYLRWTSGSTFTDWGNEVGGNMRTLTLDEWVYVLTGRENASKLIGVASVNGVNGLVILPDDWLSPPGITFKHGFLEEGQSYASKQVFSTIVWEKMEQYGAVFLPAAGYENEAGVQDKDIMGAYWTATEYDENHACFIGFDVTAVVGYYGDRSMGCCVRLVKDL